MKTLVIVDDDELVRRGLSRRLKRTFHALEADSPSQFQRLASSEHIDAVLTDYDMPEGGGAAVIEYCRTNKIPCVLHTGSYVRIEGQIAVSKPAETSELTSALEQAMKESA